MTAEVHGTPSTQRRPLFGWRRAFVATSVLVAMLGTGVVVLPFVLINASWRDRMLGSAVNTEVLTATSEAASGGWFAPLTFHNVRISDAEDRIVCRVSEVRTSKGLLSFLYDSSQVGQIRLFEPRVEIHVGKDGKWPDCGKQEPSNIQLSFAIEDGAFLMTVPWRQVPIVDLDNLQITGTIGADVTGRRMLTVDATQIFDHERLSEAHTQQNLALVVPILSQSTQVSGTASVWIEQFQIPLAGAEESAMSFPVRGRVEFHSLEARLKENWTRQLVALTGQLTGAALPDRIEVLKDSAVTFVVADDGIFHDGMVFLLPQLAENLSLETSGVMHLDECLDMRLAVTIPQISVANRPILALLSQLSNAPLLLQVRGTVSQPQLQLPEGATLFGEVSKRVAPAQYQEETPTLPSAISNILQGVGGTNGEQAQEDLPGNILNLIRAIDQAKQTRAERRKQKAK